MPGLFPLYVPDALNSKLDITSPYDVNEKAINIRKTFFIYLTYLNRTICKKQFFSYFSIYSANLNLKNPASVSNGTVLVMCLTSSHAPTVRFDDCSIT